METTPGEVQMDGFMATASVCRRIDMNKKDGTENMLKENSKYSTLSSKVDCIFNLRVFLINSKQ